MVLDYILASRMAWFWNQRSDELVDLNAARARWMWRGGGGLATATGSISASLRWPPMSCPDPAGNGSRTWWSCCSSGGGG
jgi:hypothetical protein